ncbi:MAG: BON domain-containing protein [Alphaproteobacteria bacterium]
MSPKGLGFALILSLLTVSLLGGCELAIMAGANSFTKAVTTVAEERGPDGAFDDKKIQWDINGQWLAHDVLFLHKVTTTVREGNVLLTGVVPNAKLVAKAERLVREVPGVRNVYNEIEVASADNDFTLAHDTWITGALWGKMTLDGQVQFRNYAFEVVNGSVYLIGIAQSPAELERVVDYARGLNYVKRVVSYVRVKEAAKARDRSAEISYPSPTE